MQGSSSGSQNQQDVWGAQQPGLQSLYANANQILAGGGGAAASDQVGQQARDAWAQQLQPGGNPYFSQNVEAAINQSNDAFKRSVLPELDARGVGVGQYGGTRDQLARGEAAGLQAQGNAQQAAQMYSQQYGMDQQARNAALQQTGAMQGTNFANQYAAGQMLGGPTVLGSGTSQADSYGQSLGQSASTAQGSTDAWQRAANVSQSAGEGRSFGWNQSGSFGGKE